MGHSRPQVTADLGFLAELAGTWEGFGFNLIGRPDKQGGSPVFLELNQTFETLSFTPISSTIPNRGFAVDGIVAGMRRILSKHVCPTRSDNTSVAVGGERPASAMCFAMFYSCEKPSLSRASTLLSQYKIWQNCNVRSVS
jgi:hypothetical protein